MKYCHNILLFFAVSIFAYSSDSLKINYSGKTYFTEDILNNEIGNISLTADRSLDIKVPQIINKLLDFYSGKGFPLAVIITDSLKERDGRVDLYLNIDSGEYIKYGQIIFSGNKISRSEALLKQTGLELKARFNEAEIAGACGLLYKTQLFMNKPGYNIIRTENGYGIKFNIIEKKYLQVMLMGGYSAGEETDNISGLADIKADNIFGTLRKAGVRWERIEGKNEKLKLSYREPFLLGYRISTHLKFDQDYRKGYYLSREYGFEETFDLNSRSGIRSGISRKNIYPDSLYAGPQNDIITDRYSGGITYSSEYIFEAVPRSEGFFIDGEISSINIDIKDSSSVRGSELKLSSGILQKFSKYYYMRISTLYDHIIFSENIPEFSRISFGGAGSLRGYREDFFMSDIFIRQSADLYFVPESEELAFSLFFENAFYNDNPGRIQKAKQLTSLQSYGGGLIIQFRSGEVSAVVGIPAEAGFSRGVIHVRYSVRF